MTSYATRIRSLFDEIDRTPWGPQERALVAEAVALAQESGDERLEYEARMRQTSSANMIGDTDLMLTSFAWCLAHHDNDPERFPAVVEPAGDLLWQYKWMAGALSNSPEFAPTQISAVLDDMDDHYRRAGVGSSGVLMARFEDAWSAGRMDEAAELQQKLEATPRDDYSHCDACVRSQFAGFFAETGREDEAIRLVQEMLDGGFSCGEEPEHALARILLPYLRAGKLDDARSAHLRSYRLAKDNAANLAIIAHNVVFCAVTGNEARALALVEKHLPWLVHDGLDAAAHETALASFAVGLDAVATAGHPDAPVRGSDAGELVSVFGEHDGPWGAAELAARAWQEAEKIAAAFDARNATDAHARELARLREAATERYDVPIRSHEFSTLTPAEEPQTAQQRVQRALLLSSAGSSAAIDVIRSALPDAAGDDRVALTSHLVSALVSYGQTDEAAAALAERLPVLRAEGHAVQAGLEEKLGLVLFGVDLVEALPRVEAELAALGAEHLAPRADLLSTIAIGRLWAGEHEAAASTGHGAAELFAQAGDIRRAHGMRLLEADARSASGDGVGAAEILDALLADPAVDDGRRVRTLVTRARLHGAAEEFAAGAAAADDAARIAVSIGVDDAMTSEAFLLAAMLHEDAGAPAEAVGRYRVAAERRDTAGLPSTDVRFRQGRAMLAAGYAAEAVDTLNDVLREESESGVEAASRALTAALLAQALQAAEEYGNAVGAWSYAADLREEAEDAVGRAYALVQQGRLLGRFGATDDAIEVLTEAVGIVRGNDDEVGLLADGLHTLAQAHQQRGDDEALVLIEEALELGRRHDADWFVADVLDTRARLHASRGEVDAAVATALHAADGFAGAGDIGGAGGSELLAARVLREADRPGDAVALYRAAFDHASEIEPLRQTVALELGDVLESLGRHAEAAEVRAVLPA
ncbi:hypothetical protein ITJ43_13100 [Microbacterium sp. VKM Ac-2870]|uniref:hypothetical protein n=1 Tax=Microbacterium sp. VKM Ac-2870 TaxID=2783825 RepID=UPI00188AC653|nr:hypothetical protein [Microbacterium sp. VKM Ac-2870]MBF4563069.1 hypothetical protein [Microbacterium sp. VKM Ac-2870]